MNEINVNALKNALAAIAEALRPIVESIQQIVTVLVHEQKKRGNNYWSYIRLYNPTRECPSKNISKQQTNIMRSRAWPSFKKYQRRRPM